MPIYEFQCNRCSKVTEEFFHGNPPDFQSCSCGGKARRILSVFQGPEQMKGMQMLSGGQKFVKARQDWRNRVDEGKIAPPPR